MILARNSPGSPVPSIAELMNPVLDCIRELGGSATNAEIVDGVIERMKLSPEVADYPHGDGPKSEVDYRIGWAKTHLKQRSLINNSRRGVWSLTERGRNSSSVVAPAHQSSVLRESAQRQHRDWGQRAAEPNVHDDEEVGDDDWQEALLKVMSEMPPDAFERFCGRLLRESGFDSVVVTGRSGDGGIDGQGVIRLAGGMIGFPVYFQCKRYTGNVPSGAVRDFRGAMQGRGDRGLIITTGHFTTDAMREATRAGAPPIDLVDGVRLAEKVKELGLGVTVTERVVEDVTVDAEWFGAF